MFKIFYLRLHVRLFRQIGRQRFAAIALEIVDTGVAPLDRMIVLIGQAVPNVIKATAVDNAIQRVPLVDHIRSIRGASIVSMAQFIPHRSSGLHGMIPTDMMKPQ